MCVPVSSGFSPLRLREQLWRSAQPSDYAFRLSPFGFIETLLMAYVCRLSGLREMVERFSSRLGTANFSTLSHAIRRASSLRLVRLLCDFLEFGGQPRANALIALDSMAITLPKTQRHRCKKFNDKTVGGGVLWAFLLDAARGVNPVRVLKTMQGAWSDARQMEGVELILNGPIYLMDRGFFKLAFVERMLRERVRFIMRLRKDVARRHELIRAISQPRFIGGKRLTLDALVELGGPKSKSRPRARLLMVVLPDGEELCLLTDRLELSAETLLAMYKRRWEIEGFHRLVKDVLGFAHLYSFDQQGIEFLLRVALLLALLLYLGADGFDGKTLELLRVGLRRLRRALGLTAIWRRNSCIRPRSAKKRGKGKNR